VVLVRIKQVVPTNRHHRLEALDSVKCEQRETCC